MIMTEVLTPKKLAEEFMKEAANKPVFSGIAFVPGALPQCRAGKGGKKR